MNSQDFLNETFTTIKHAYGDFPSQKKEKPDDQTLLGAQSKGTSITTLRKSVKMLDKIS